MCKQKIFVIGQRFCPFAGYLLASLVLFAQYPPTKIEDSSYRNWRWEISVTDEEKPVIAVVRISEDKNSHDYYHVRWTGKEWRKTFLSHTGGHFHQTPGLEKCYSGGMAIDKASPSVIYGSVPVEGKQGRVYELKKFTVTPEGSLAAVEQLTYDSPKNNIRPFVISNEGEASQMVWMYGDYYDWIVSSARPGYPTAIRTNMDIPSTEINPDKGLLYHNSSGPVLPDDVEAIDIPESEKFTIVATLSVDHDAFCGEIIRTDAFTYGIERGEQPKPYIRVEKDKNISCNVLGNSDAWRTQNRGTGGHWYVPVKPELFQLAITYEEGVLRTYIDGLIDQYAEIKGLLLSEISFGGFKVTVNNIRIYNRALSQDAIKALN